MGRVEPDHPCVSAGPDEARRQVPGSLATRRSVRKLPGNERPAVGLLAGRNLAEQVVADRCCGKELTVAGYEDRDEPGQHNAQQQRYTQASRNPIRSLWSSKFIFVKPRCEP